jgi:hypothetical protein
MVLNKTRHVPCVRSVFVQTCVVTELQLKQCTVSKCLEISDVSADSYMDRVQVHIHLTVL